MLIGELINERGLSGCARRESAGDGVGELRRAIEMKLNDEIARDGNRAGVAISNARVAKRHAVFIAGDNRFDIDDGKIGQRHRRWAR